LQPTEPTITPKPTTSAAPTLTATPTASPTPTQTPKLSAPPTPNTSPTPTPSPAFRAYLSESASALYFGNTINFTCSTNGGEPPYIYTWYIDSNIENSSSLYYAIDNAAIGSHHVYVKVTDVENETAESITVEFNVLPSPSNTYTPSPSSTEQSTTEPTLTPINDNAPNYSLLLTIAVVIIVTMAALAGALIYFKKKKKINQTRN
jgi:hypothetical protein